MLRPLGEIVIQNESDGLYVKVVASFSGSNWYGGSRSLFILFVMCVVIDSIGRGDHWALIVIPLALTLICLWEFSGSAKKELWIANKDLRYRVFYGIAPSETNYSALISPCVDNKNVFSVGGGYYLVMYYPHCGEKVVFFEKMRLSEQEAREICDAVEAYISGNSIE